MQYVPLNPLHNLAKARKVGQIHLLSHTYLKILMPGLPTFNPVPRSLGHCPQNICPCWHSVGGLTFRIRCGLFSCVLFTSFPETEKPPTKPPNWDPLPVLLLFSLGPSVFSGNWVIQCWLESRVATSSTPRQRAQTARPRKTAPCDQHWHRTYTPLVTIAEGVGRRGALKSGMGASHPLGVYWAPEGSEVPGGRGVECWVDSRTM